MIEHIDKYFNPSAAVNLLGYIFELIDIKQDMEENVVLLKAWLSWVFASMKMGGVMIDSALQVGFMLLTLLSCHQAVIQDFRLGRHALTFATLQLVVKLCTTFDKDP